MIITNILKIILKEDIFLPMKYQQEIRYSIFQIKQSLTWETVYIQPCSGCPEEHEISSHKRMMRSNILNFNAKSAKSQTC